MLLLDHERLRGRKMCVLFCLETIKYSPETSLQAFITLYFVFFGLNSLLWDESVKAAQARGVFAEDKAK